MIIKLEQKDNSVKETKENIRLVILKFSHKLFTFYLTAVLDGTYFEESTDLIR